MTSVRIILRSLLYHARTNLCVVLGLAVATAVITGSLLVGESMHASLLRQATARLGRVDAALVAPHFFRAALAEELARDPAVAGRIGQAAAAILLRGVAKSPETDVAVSDVRICGVDSEFAAFFPEPSLPALTGLQAVVNQALADDLNLKPGDDVLLVLDRPSLLPGQSLFTRRKRQDTLRTLRVQVLAVLPNRGAGGFSLDSSPATPRLAYVPRDTLARALRQEGKANAILINDTNDPPGFSKDPLTTPLAGRVPSTSSTSSTSANLDQVLLSRCRLEDFGLHLVTSTAGGYVALETDGILLTLAQLDAAKKSAAELKLTAAPTSVYLATRISTTANPPRSIHYTIFATLESPPAFKFLAGNGPEPAADGMFLNSWAAEDLGASVGDELEITYLVPQPDGTYREDHLRRKLQAIVDLSGPAADPQLTPALGGLTDAARIEKWDVPFPLDPSKITPRDDQYWDRYRATPKAFVSMATIRQVWASAGMGSGAHDPVTSLRFHLSFFDPELDFIADPLTASLLKELSPAAAGLTFQPVRQLAQDRSAGNTDLGVLLLSMSMFLIAAAAGLSGTLLRLSIARRAAELGLLLACGWKRSAAGRLLLWETLLLAVAGALLGLPLGILYCQAMIELLGQSSVGSWQQVDLTLQVDAPSLIYGAVSGLAVGLVCAVWGLWTLRKRPVLNLLAGWQGLANRIAPSRWPKFALPVLAVAAVVPLFLATPGGSFNPAIAFFLSGACLLIAGILVTHLVLSVHHHRRGVPISLTSLAVRSAALNRGRSLLIVGLFACASFILVAVAANYRDAGRMSLDNPASPAGGFNLRVTTSLPLPSDPATPAGLANLGFSPADQQLLARTAIVPFLVASGDDISCLSLTRPGRPRLLGAGPSMINRGGFTVDLARPQAGSNPWAALLPDDPEGAIPVFGDADSVRWTLHSDLGQILTLPGPAGAPLRLRIAGLLSGSIFGGELVMSADNLRKLYPNLVGPACLLIQCPPQDEAAVANVFRRNLADFGVEVRTTREILSAYLSVQNLYLSLFLMLGGLGLFLGAAGLLAVILRNVLERRRELALMSACGFARSRLVRWLLAEHAGLLLAGLLCGTVAALVAVAPTLAARETQVPWITLLTMLGGIGLVGVLACAAGARLAIRTDVIVALRQE